MKCGVNQGKIHVCMCGEKQNKGGTRNTQDCMEVVMEAPVCLTFLGCICKDGVGTITDVEGNINSAKYKDILDNNLLLVVLKLENFQWIFQDDSAPGTPVSTYKIVET